ncbi:MAG: DKNYY domain-containing protein [Clostridia bacterium]|nr:DKNYY domain-containing protein [Clostridia bacterium]
MKRTLVLLVALCYICTSLVVTAGAVSEADCSEWAKESIERAYNCYLLDPEEEYEFKENISRLDFCDLAFRLVLNTPYFQSWYNENVGEDETEFPSFDEYAFEDTDALSVLFLRYLGIVNGKSETSFAPNDFLTREEAATIVVRLIDAVTPMDATEVWYEYDDASDISGWALSSVQKISNLGFMRGVGQNQFAPKEIYTVEQAVVTIVRVYDANILNWFFEFMVMEAGELGYVYENGTWNYITYSLETGRVVNPMNVDEDTFKVLENEKFAVDKRKVFLMGDEIEGADPKTFEIISDEGNMRYAKDKDSVYIYLKDGEIMEVFGADPKTFEVLAFPYAKDKDDAYNGCLPLFVDDVSKFEVVESGEGWICISFPESFFTTAINTKEVAEYNKEKYGFIDSAVIYSEEGKAKTEKLVYEGYRVVEE